MPEEGSCYFISKSNAIIFNRKAFKFVALTKYRRAKCADELKRNWFCACSNVRKLLLRPRSYNVENWKRHYSANYRVKIQKTHLILSLFGARAMEHSDQSASFWSLTLQKPQSTFDKYSIKILRHVYTLFLPPWCEYLRLRFARNLMGLRS